MRKKPNFNFSLPANLAQAFEELAHQFSPRRRWAVLTAALLLYLELSPRMQQAWAQRVFTADLIPGELDRMISGARRRCREGTEAEKAAVAARNAAIAALKAVGFRKQPPKA